MCLRSVPDSLIFRVDMNLQALIATFFAALVACATAAVDHDKVEPFPQPEPVTISEKAAIKFKPQLVIPQGVCVSYPAVNAAGEVGGGLNDWDNGNDACLSAALGSQVYGRAGWHKDRWAIMYAWYFPKDFWTGFPTHRHDWKSVVVWIDNPALEIPKIEGVSMSKSDTKYKKKLKLKESYFSGAPTNGSNTSLRFEYEAGFGSTFMGFTRWDGEYQTLIMWEQLTDAARATLNDGNNFGKEASVPFSDEHFEDRLDEAWPF
ncbi:hypothetical protein PInf_011124 [Phytophthora infestans]|nr:hypothetical protein PInf_011124 [Phytophthora infestans]